ncbi:MAG: hypothetical protein A2W27_04870 [Deltaproteobacteria bacterium RBG_16_44_11]|nr:MAG: hypothetical protein A2W27_04870 [Deltaproteobacteria bacterium RBG_16_44_11]
MNIATQKKSYGYHLTLRKFLPKTPKNTAKSKQPLGKKHTVFGKDIAGRIITVMYKKQQAGLDR